MPVVSDIEHAKLDALSVYSQMEFSLAMLFAGIVGCERDVGILIFYRISNNRARYALIDDLLTLRFDGKVTKFWAGVEKRLAKLDGARNNLVHWGLTSSLDSATGVESNVAFRPLHKWASGSEGGRMTLADTKKLATDASEIILITSPLLMCSGNSILSEAKKQAIVAIYERPFDENTKSLLNEIVYSPEAAP